MVSWTRPWQDIFFYQNVTRPEEIYEDQSKPERTARVELELLHFNLFLGALRSNKLEQL